MFDRMQVLEYASAGREDGVMASVQLFHTAQICEMLDSGSHILDLGCGPANQTAQIAALNPECEFVGLDLSSEMLAQGKRLVEESGLANLSFTHGAMENLSQFADATFDVVISTLALHHLPDQPSLEKTLQEVRRVLRPKGRIYLGDLGRLR